MHHVAIPNHRQAERVRDLNPPALTNSCSFAINGMIKLSGIGTMKIRDEIENLRL
jgi:hypothetical protein